MKKAWILSLIYCVTMPVLAGEEFWNWKEAHQESIAQGDIEISVDDTQYIKQLSAAWTQVSLSFDDFKPIEFPKDAIANKMPKPVTFRTSKVTLSEIAPVEILETPHLLNERINFDFYEHKFIIKDSVNWSMNTEITTEQDIASAWQFLSSKSTQSVLGQFKMLKEVLHLNDWDYAFMLFEYSKIWQTSLNARLMQTQYLLIQSGFNVRVGLADNSIVLLMNTQHKILNESYVIDERKKRWVVMDLDNKATTLATMKWINQSHKKAREIFNLRMNPDLDLGAKWEAQLLTYQIGVEQFEIYIPYNTALIKHYKTYPILPLSDYVNNDIHTVINQSITDQLNQYLDTSNEKETIIYLLAFVQTLKNNNEAIERDRPQPILLQEAIYAQSISTYEKVVLFKALVNRLLNNYMMIVEYEKHLALGIKLKSEHKLKTFRVNLGDYVLADPSYINVVLGKKMPIEDNPFVQWHPLY